MALKKDLKEQLYAQYKGVQDVTLAYMNGEEKGPAVKKLSVLLGIYKDRTEVFMLRTRQNGGVLTVQNMRDMGDVMDQVGITRGHLSTRQNVQLHGVPLTRIEEALKAFYERGMVTRGGGGNTIRTNINSSRAGVSATEVFDTKPYLEGMWDYVFGYQRAFEFGRKFKVGFSSEACDDNGAGVQDIGFIPQVVDGEKGFKVYGGGGMGRGASTGIVLFDFLPVKQVTQAVVAMIDVFYEKGNRENRSKGRLRFILQELGEEKFKEMYMDFFNKVVIPEEYLDFREIDYKPLVDKLTKFEDSAIESAEYKRWVERSVKETKFDDVVSVRLYVRKGDFNAEEFRTFADILTKVGSEEIRISPEQDAIIPLLHKSALPYLYRALEQQLPKQASTNEMFDRHIVSCIGAEVCPIGILASPAAALTVAESLDCLFGDRAELKNELFEEIVNSVLISGCASSCSRNQSSALGFHGAKKKIDGVSTEVYQVHVGGLIVEGNDHQLAKTDPTWLVKASDIGSFTSNVVAEFLSARENDEFTTLREFTIAKRDTFKIEDYI